MKVRFARVITGFSGSELAKTPQAARPRAPDLRALRGAKLATAIVYPYVAEPARVAAAPSSWPFAPTTPPAGAKPEQALVQVPAPEPERERADLSPAPPLAADAAVDATPSPSIKAPPIQVPPPAGSTEPPPAPPTEPSAEVAAPPQLESPSLSESAPAVAEEIGPAEPLPGPLPATVEIPAPADSQPVALDTAADGGEQLEPGLEERPSRARIVERLWEDPIREELEVNLGATTESNLYVDVDLRVANGGVFVATYQALPLGTQVSLNITLAGGLATSAHGRVTLQRESLEAFGDAAPGVCVAFELLSSEALALLEQFAAIRTPWLIEDE
ncbi:MAG TPA: hypothetical protein VJV78_44920 [Polyangiales bacterium]|nr:hypothetical protein [Polyangiales bacterium]